MIGTLRGKILKKIETTLIIECSGVGYLVHVPLNVAENLPKVGEDAFVYIHTAVREDSISLYGFDSETGKELFLLLLSISGIGPKSALGILSSLDYRKLQTIVLSSDVVSLSKLPGIGKKTAERIIVEIKDKIAKINIAGSAVPTVVESQSEEAIMALSSLGYSKARSEAMVTKALRRGEYSNIQDLLKASLKMALEK